MTNSVIMIEMPTAEPAVLREFADAAASLARMLDPEATTWVSFPPPEAELWEETQEIELTGRFQGRLHAPKATPR